MFFFLYYRAQSQIEYICWLYIIILLYVPMSWVLPVLAIWRCVFVVNNNGDEVNVYIYNIDIKWGWVVNSQ